MAGMAGSIRSHSTESGKSSCDSDFSGPVTLLPRHGPAGPGHPTKHRADAGRPDEPGGDGESNVGWLARHWASLPSFEPGHLARTAAPRAGG